MPRTEALRSASTPLWQCTATELAAATASGEISALEVVDAHVARIEEANPPLNAVVARRYELARSEARAADRKRLSREPLGPLHGVPVVIKDSIDVAGLPTTGGIPSRALALADADDRHVARLRAAGAIVLAKTNVAQLLIFLETDNPLHGRTQNPWDLERTPGGSSGGQAALIAAGGAPLGLGTDIGGSNRVPAAFCGIVGFKPTKGRLPDLGRVSVPLGEQTITSQIGVFARTVEDVAVGLAIANGGSHPPDPTALPLLDWRGVELAKTRIAVFDSDGIFAPCPAARRAVATAAAYLRSRGATVVPWQPPGLEEVLPLFLGLLSADGGERFRELLGRDRRDPRVALLMTAARASSATRRLLKALVSLSGRRKVAQSLDLYGDRGIARYFALVERALAYRAVFAQALDRAPGGRIDAVLSPASPLPALRHGATAEVGIMGTYSCLWNVLGYPAGVVPVTSVDTDEESDRAPSRDKMDAAARDTERGSVGLPMAVQVASRPGCEHVSLAVLAASEADACTAPDYPALTRVWS